MEDWLEAGLTANRMERTYIPVCQKKSFRGFVVVTERGSEIVAEVVTVHNTLWAPAIERTSHQDLLGVVANECGKNGMAAAPDPIAAHHCNTRFAVGHNWG
jgi:hypothetical protein